MVSSDNMERNRRCFWVITQRVLIVAVLAVAALSLPASPQSDSYKQKMEETRRQMEAQKQEEVRRQEEARKRARPQRPAETKKQAAAPKKSEAPKQAEVQKKAEAPKPVDAQKKAEVPKPVEVREKAEIPKPAEVHEKTETPEPAATHKEADTPTKAEAPKRAEPAVRASTSKSLEDIIAAYLGIPYKYGGTTKDGMDCSAFVGAVYYDAYNYDLPRTSRDMWTIGRKIEMTEARPGDLVFFKGSGLFAPIDHVGIYVGSNRFAHASSSKGVVYEDLSGSYYKKRFAGVRRVR